MNDLKKIQADLGAALDVALDADPRLIDRLPDSVAIAAKPGPTTAEYFRTRLGVALLDALNADPRLIDRLPARVIDAIDAFGAEVMAS